MYLLNTAKFCAKQHFAMYTVSALAVGDEGIGCESGA